MENRFLPILTALLAAAVLQPVFCVSLEELVGVERAAALRAATGPITEVQLRDPIPGIMPTHDELRRLVGETMGSLGPNLFVETLSLYRIGRPPQGSATGLGSDEQTSLFNQLVALSTLSGIQYYSESRRAMRTFYEYSRIIDSPTAKNPLPDPVFAAPPAALTLLEFLFRKNGDILVKWITGIHNSIQLNGSVIVIITDVFAIILLVALKNYQM